MSFLKQKQTFGWGAKWPYFSDMGFQGVHVNRSDWWVTCKSQIGKEACSFPSGSEKTWEPRRGALSRCGAFLQWVCGAQPELLDDPIDVSLAGEEPHPKPQRAHRCQAGAPPWTYGLRLSSSSLASHKTLQTTRPDSGRSEPCGKYSQPHFSNWEQRRRLSSI